MIAAIDEFPQRSQEVAHKLKLGVKHAESTIDRYRVPAPRSPDDSQRWRAFLKYSADAIRTADFFTQYTVGFRALFVFVVMHIASRKAVHFAITEHPTLGWIKQQIRYATFDGVRPKFLIHDNDGRYGQLGHTVRLFNESKGKAHSCRSTLTAWLRQTLNTRCAPIPYGAPNAAADMERHIGTLRRECLDHLLIWNERHLHLVPVRDDQMFLAEDASTRGYTESPIRIPSSLNPSPPWRKATSCPTPSSAGSTTITA